jgi:putative ATPase
MSSFESFSVVYSKNLAFFLAMEELLFNVSDAPRSRRFAPLAERRRPTSLDGILGQPHLTATESALRRMASRGELASMLFWGPPGCGKTTLARCLARLATRRIVELSAVQSGVKDLRREVDASAQSESPTVLFIDEIHHLNKSQQDILLPALEAGVVSFIGATTENPSFSVNKAVMSRCLCFKLEALGPETLKEILRSALDAETSGKTDISDEALAALTVAADGDARRALNLLAAAIAAVDESDRMISMETLKLLNVDAVFRYDANGEQHYDLVSAMIKSIRASHPDAALYYLARMLSGGELLSFIARRLLIAASEDIGNANPTALLIAQAGFDAVQKLGMPEARIVLSQVVTYLAASPKSNRAYVAIDAALADVKAYGSLEVPLHLRNGVTNYLKVIGYGELYRYPHDDAAGAQQSTYLPPELSGRRYYEPSQSGTEATLAASLKKQRPVRD